jgi:hypothetical protein
MREEVWRAIIVSVERGVEGRAEGKGVEGPCKGKEEACSLGMDRGRVCGSGRGRHCVVCGMWGVAGGGSKGGVYMSVDG